MTVSSQAKPRLFEKIMSFQSFPDVRFLEIAKTIKTNLEKMRLRFVSDVVLFDLFVKCGNYVRTINTLSIPFRFFLDGWDIMFPSTKHMQTVTSHSFFFRLTQNP